MKKLTLIFLLLSGCTAPSTKIALEGGVRVQATQDEIFNKQHQALEIAYYVELRAFCEKLVGRTLNTGEADRLNEIWVTRSGMENFVKQWERARALRIITVDTKLYNDQSIFDLIYKRLEDIFNANPPTSQPVDLFSN